jgi:hypothetical protein
MSRSFLSDGQGASSLCHLSFFFFPFLFERWREAVALNNRRFSFLLLVKVYCKVGLLRTPASAARK